MESSGRWLRAMCILLVVCFCGTARAQTLNVTLSTDGTQSLSAGSSFSNGGTITVTANAVPSGTTVSITTVRLSIGNAAVFNSLSLNGSSPSGTETFNLPLTSGSNTASFSSMKLTNGQSASFALDGTVSSTPPGGTGVTSRRELQNVRLASMLPAAAGGVSMMLTGLIALGLMAISGRLRRRHLVMFAIWTIIAATVVGCGQGGSASSDQQVMAVGATSSNGGTVSGTGLPVDMGTITLQINTSSGTPGQPTATPVGGNQAATGLLNSPGIVPLTGRSGP
jgi:hypothetical protein